MVQNNNYRKAWHATCARRRSVNLIVGVDQFNHHSHCIICNKGHSIYSTVEEKKGNKI